MKNITGKYGLTPQEFEELCTVPSPTSRPSFYPFHILSRPQATEIWEWNTVYSIATSMLHRMQTRCNQYAERAGFGERRMNPLWFIY